ncbi:acyl-CoA synthase [Corynebacterium atypicum]|uniref:Acyl-CoA synthase n=1 Tax=Corynebacterium atypicum TaxID=191610 RepID=A0ABN4DET7_9CORY|nr:FadD32-like long-chain-fatty-acid--AMP ligase [Corynebacterium atypicum]AIG64813.1 acyl-CoA synthase [Corynebacterium atypicum]
MDLTSAMGQFFTERGEIALPEQLTLAGMCELIYQSEAAQGGSSRVALRDWDFGTEVGGTPREFTRAQVNTRIKAVAARLQQVAQPGARAAILAGNSAEYLFAFMGALYAGVTPVPLYDPDEPGHAAHLKAVFADSEPAIVLTNRPSAKAVRSYFAELPGTERPRIIAVDSLPDTLAESWRNPLETQAGKALAQSGTKPVDLPAFLQYTSGSTRTPAGVLLTNRSIVTNVLQIFAAGKLKSPLRLVNWIPLHHDMGIILAAFVIILGIEFDLFAPRDFIQRPSRWMERIAHREGDVEPTGNRVNVYTVVPNFALELAVRHGMPKGADQDNFDLSVVDGIIIGSEPVTARSIESFLAAFEPFGLSRAALRPSYGLAEASLLVTTPQTDNRPVITHFDREELAAGRAQVTDQAGEDTVTFISNGQVVRPQALTIVDPDTREELPDAVVGELWAHGENMAAGYLGRPEETAETFANTLAGRLSEGSRAAGVPDEGWMATGDLGTIIAGEVYVTGRRKDLIVIAGRNHYPQDIEVTVGESTEQINPDAVAAFSVPGEDVEELIVLAERADGADPAGDDAAARDIRAAVTATHGVAPAEVRILDAHTIPRSSSAKIARRVAAQRFHRDRAR